MVACLAWLMVPANTASGNDLELGELLRTNAAARGFGPRPAAEAIRVEMSLLQPELSARVVLLARRPGNLRVDVWIDNEWVFAEAGNGRTGWFRVRGGAPRTSSAAGVARLLHVAADLLYPLHEMDNAGFELARREPTRIDGRLYDTLEMRHAAVPRRLLYMDRKSRFVTRERTIAALQPDLNPEKRWIETLHSDFRLVEGIAYSFQRDYVDVTTLDWLQTQIIEEVVFDPELPPDWFHWRWQPQPES